MIKLIAELTNIKLIDWWLRNQHRRIFRAKKPLGTNEPVSAGGNAKKWRECSLTWGEKCWAQR